MPNPKTSDSFMLLINIVGAELKLLNILSQGVEKDRVEYSRTSYLKVLVLLSG